MRKITDPICHTSQLSPYIDPNWQDSMCYFLRFDSGMWYRYDSRHVSYPVSAKRQAELEAIWTAHTAQAIKRFLGR